MIDVAIVGGGPAALSAAIYLGRAGLEVKVFEREAMGGTVNQIAHIGNYLGFEGAGADLAKDMKTQAETSGAKLEYGECTKVEKKNENWELLIDGEAVLAKAVLIATGSESRRLNFELEVPVSYCALCDGDLIKDQKIAVVGGANSALHEAIYLAPLCKSVTVISHSKLKAEQALTDKFHEYNNTAVIEDTEPTAELLNQFDHVFVSIGKCPATRFLPAAVLDGAGFVVTGETGNDEQSNHYETKLAGLFAAGDVRLGAVRQVITAAGEGAAAAGEIIEYLKARG